MAEQSAGQNGATEVETIRGEKPYLEVLKRIHQQLRPAFYLEIGIRRGRSLSLASGRAVGVDPDFDLQHPVNPEAQLFSEESDHFFAGRASEVIPNEPALAFIDGMHLFDFALRDFINTEKHLHPASLIVIDDVFPNLPAQASRERTTKVWTGDVWKLEPCLREYRPDLNILLLDTSPSGLMLISGLDSANTVLANSYEDIVDRFVASGDFDTPSRDVLDRETAVSPDHQAVDDMINSLVHQV